MADTVSPSPLRERIKDLNTKALLLRQYFPRGTDLSSISQERRDQIELLLNQRPRKTLGFRTPASKLRASVASPV
jgi:IS30 family transposase